MTKIQHSLGVYIEPEKGYRLEATIMLDTQFL